MRYKPMAGGRALNALFFTPFAIVSVFLIIKTIGGDNDAPPILFTLVWLAGVGWNAYWWLFRIASEIALDPPRLTAKCPFQKRTVPLHEIMAIRPMRVAPNLVIFVIHGQRPIITMVVKGFREFTEEIQRIRPDLPIRLGKWTKLTEALPGRYGIK